MITSIDGTVVGGIEEIGIYQIHIPDSEDLTLLKEVINDLEDNSSIKLVSPNIELHENKTPDEDKDPAWDEGNPGDSWDEDNPGGNNWGLEFIFPFARFKTFAFQANSFSMFRILNIEYRTRNFEQQKFFKE